MFALPREISPNIEGNLPYVNGRGDLRLHHDECGSSSSPLSVYHPSELHPSVILAMYSFKSTAAYASSARGCFHNARPTEISQASGST